MQQFQTAIVDHLGAVDQRLADWGLVRQQFAAIAKVARSWADDASPVMPLNAPGTLAYIFGVAELRNQLVDEDWRVERKNGVEAVLNTRLGLRIGFHNVDAACDASFPPQPRSAKGSASEGLSSQTLFEFYGFEPGPLTGTSEDSVPTYYVMVGEDGSVELSNPIIRDGTYRHFIERIFIYKPAEDWAEDIVDDEGPADDFEVDVSFKDQS